MGNHTVHYLCRLWSVSPRRFDRQELEDMEQFLASNFDKGPGAASEPQLSPQIAAAAMLSRP